MQKVGGTYITELNLNYASISVSSQSSTSLVNSGPNSQRYKKNRIDVVTKLKSQTVLDKQLKENFLDYLIQDQTSFADLKQIENFYNKQAVKNQQRYNSNLRILSNKKTEYETLLNSIEESIITYMTIQENEGETNYEKTSSELTSKIKRAELDGECYNNIYRDLYKRHYLISKQLEEEQKYDNENQKQFEKYEILNNHALMTVKNQSTMLANVKNYLEMSRATYKTEITKKTKQFNELEFQVLMLKKDSKSKVQESWYRERTFSFLPSIGKSTYNKKQQRY